MDLGLIEGILKVQSAYIYLYRWLGGGKLGHFYLAHIECAIRVPLSHFDPSRDVWFGHNKYFI